jgi:phosphoadenosine phosphosulfate reductase
VDKEDSRLYSKLPVFRRRIARARLIISEAQQTIIKPYLSCSFGKDSVVLLHMVLQQAPDIPVVFINSGYCFPDTYEVRDRFIRDYNINLVEIQQPHDYMEIIDRYGLPDDRTPAQQDKVVRLLKKDLANEWAKTNGYDGHFWGIRKDESAGRRVILNNRGPLFYAQVAGLWRCSPLADWRWEDIWAYVHSNNIPYSKIYKKTGFCDPRQIRNTSWVTTDGAAHNGRVAWLKYYYPELYAKLITQIPEIRRYV